MKNIDFLLNKLRYFTDTKTDKELCKVLDISYSTMDTWKNNDKIPKKRLYDISNKISIPFNELIETMNYENQIDEIFEQLFNFYKVSTITELSKCLNMNQSSVTNWKARNSISAIKKKCRELGIYNDIFVVQKEDKNMNNILINGILLEQAKEKASQYGLSINAYLEFLIVQDLK